MPSFTYFEKCTTHPQLSAVFSKEPTFWVTLPQVLKENTAWCMVLQGTEFTSKKESPVKPLPVLLAKLGSTTWKCCWPVWKEQVNVVRAGRKGQLEEWSKSQRSIDIDGKRKGESISFERISNKNIEFWKQWHHLSGCNKGLVFVSVVRWVWRKSGACSTKQ